jgi:hypothetical protein
MKKKLLVLFCGLILSGIGMTYAEDIGMVVIDCGDGRKYTIHVDVKESDLEELDKIMADLWEWTCEK